MQLRQRSLNVGGKRPRRQPQPPRNPPRPGWLRRSPWAIILVLLLPAAVNIVVFRYLPLVEAGRASTREISLIGGDSGSVGGANFARAFEDPAFWQSLSVTLQFVLVRVPILIVLGIGLALLLVSATRASSITRVAVLTPTVTSIVVVSVLWTLIYNPSSGLLNSFLELFGVPAQAYLSDPDRALGAVAAMSIWKDIGLSMLIFLAALQSLPPDQVEAAKVDGAGPVRVFRYVTFPHLRPTILLVSVVMTVASFQLFAPVFAMTQGGPQGVTRITVYYIYQQAFRFNDLGYASAMSLLLLVLLLGISLLQALAFRRRD